MKKDYTKLIESSNNELKTALEALRDLKALHSEFAPEDYLEYIKKESDAIIQALNHIRILQEFINEVSPTIIGMKPSNN